MKLQFILNNDYSTQLTANPQYFYCKVYQGTQISSSFSSCLFNQTSNAIELSLKNDILITQNAPLILIISSIIVKDSSILSNKLVFKALRQIDNSFLYENEFLYSYPNLLTNQNGSNSLLALAVNQTYSNYPSSIAEFTFTLKTTAISINPSSAIYITFPYFYAPRLGIMQLYYNFANKNGTL